MQCASWQGLVKGYQLIHSLRCLWSHGVTFHGQRLQSSLMLTYKDLCPCLYNDWDLKALWMLSIEGNQGIRDNVEAWQHSATVTFRKNAHLKLRDKWWKTRGGLSLGMQHHNLIKNNDKHRGTLYKLRDTGIDSANCRQDKFTFHHAINTQEFATNSCHGKEYRSLWTRQIQVSWCNKRMGNRYKFAYQGNRHCARRPRTKMREFVTNSCRGNEDRRLRIQRNSI